MWLFNIIIKTLLFSIVFLLFIKYSIIIWKSYLYLNNKIIRLALYNNTIIQLSNNIIIIKTHSEVHQVIIGKTLQLAVLSWLEQCYVEWSQYNT